MKSDKMCFEYLLKNDIPGVKAGTKVVYDYDHWVYVVGDKKIPTNCIPEDEPLFFEKIEKSSAFKKGDTVILKYHMSGIEKNQLLTITNVVFRNGSYFYSVKLNNGKKNILRQIKEQELELVESFYFFVNSKCLVYKDFLTETKKNSIEYKWKKATGNVFSTDKEARDYVNSKLKTI